MAIKKFNQSGVVLIVSLVFLVALTAVAAALMQNTTTDVKMAGASQVKSIVTQETISEMDRIIFNEQRRVNGPNIFVELNSPTPILSVTKPSITTAIASPDNVLSLTPCPRVKPASSDAQCRMSNVVVSRTYGKNNNHVIQVNAGIAQELSLGY
ncbi:PilX N-terminal domain-containing pilus assembly protein [Colwellia sp. UCD-KL20]|uniref:PilX N-terminal domain-containing pilus assembly protein n=1 Tax=Colwellia sp. UCD-KL20 TaxID=1917165 RepID=UPI000970CE3A|nr:PilX N-terminal domain-containing pilus assembly protein [Colwellia sp. UCD-KL20]